MTRLELVTRRTIPAPAEPVFDLWLDTEHPGGPWFGVEHVIFRPEVDGLFFYSVKSGDRSWPHYGRFIRIERPRLLEYTHVSEATGGVETIVQLAFEQKGDATEVTLTHSNVPDDELGRQHQTAWDWVLTMLAQRFAHEK